MPRVTRLLARRSTTLVAGATLLVGGLAGVVFGAGAPAAAATGANFIATGHDMDFHCSGGGTEGDLECAYFKIVVAQVRNGSSMPVLALDHGTELTTALNNIGVTRIDSVDPDDKAALNQVEFVSSSGARNYSAVIVASDASCGGCDNTPTSIANINARKAGIAKLFNKGGGILALAGAGNRDTYYDFVPLKGLTAAAVTPPFTVTPRGQALGITTPMANCCATHNSFSVPAKPLVALETDTADLVETIAAFGVGIGGGGFSSPPPPPPPPTTSAPPTGNRPPAARDQSVDTFRNTPVDITLQASDPNGDSLTYTVTNPPFHGTLSGSGKNLVYTPFDGFVGNDFFVFTVSDGKATSRQHIVNIHVLSPSEAPPLANTGPATSSHLNTGLALLAAGLMLLVVGSIRRTRPGRRH